MKKSKFLLGLACSAALSMSSLGFSGTAEAADNPFACVPAGSPLYDDVEALVNDGLVYGYEQGEFKKTRVISRMEMAIFTAKAMSAMDQASPDDAQRIGRLMKEFSGELTDMHVKIPGQETKDNKKKKSDDVKIKRMPENFDVSGLIRMRKDWGYTRNDSGKDDNNGGVKNNTLMWQLFTKFNIGGGWTGEIDFLGSKDLNGDYRTSGENTSGNADINKAFVTGPLLNGSVRMGRMKGSTVYGSSIIMGQYYQGIDYTKKAGKWKGSLSYGKIDHNTGVWSGDVNRVNSIDPDTGTVYYRPERGVSGSDMNPDGLGVTMTQIHASYQADPKFAVNAGFWHLHGSDGGWYESSKNVALGKKLKRYSNPNIFELGFDWKATKKFRILGNFAVSDDNRGNDTAFGRQNTAYALSFRYGDVKASVPHSSKLQLDLIHQGRYTGIKSSYDVKNKAGQGQRGFILDYRYVPVKNIMLDFRWMHWKSLGTAAAKTETGNQYRVQLYYYF